MLSVITGASSGIGRDMARYLSKKGSDLVLIARRQDRLEELKKELKGNVKIISLDLSLKENCESLFKQLEDTKIDYFINNAGLGSFGYFHTQNKNVITNMIDVNITCPTLLMSLFLPKFIKDGNVRILNVCSAASFTIGPLMSEYYASKSYLYKFSLGINEELRRLKSNVRVSVLCPGPVKTEFDEVAGVKFSIKGQESEYVAKYAIDKLLKGKTIIIPSKIIKIGKFLTHFVSDKFLSKVGFKFQKNKNI